MLYQIRKLLRTEMTTQRRITGMGNQFQTIWSLKGGKYVPDRVEEDDWYKPKEKRYGNGKESTEEKLDSESGKPGAQGLLHADE